MPLIRIVLLLLILGGLALLVLQNLSPVSLVFLGTTSQVLPVGIWMAIALSAGFFTSACLQVLSYLQRSSLEARIRQLKAEPSRPSQGRRESYKTETTSRQTSYTPPAQETTTADTTSDWEVEESDEEEDWDIDEEPESQPQENAVDRDQTTYEVRQEPKSSAQSGSVYSYSYREPSDSGVGKTEPVYDVNYRVITPPYRETPNEEEEDWGFEDEEDDFDDEESDDSPARR